MSARQRLTSHEIRLLRYLARVTGFVKLSAASREAVVPLWRRRLVNCLYRQEPERRHGLQGPFFQLTPLGYRLAQAFQKPDAAAALRVRPLPSRAQRAPSLQQQGALQ